MTKLLALLAVSLVLAYISEQNTKAITAAGRRYSVWNDWAYILLVAVLTLFAGLRTSYNDTGNYITGYRNAPVFSDWIADSENLNPFKNPLFYCFQSLLKSITSDPQWLILISAVISQCCFIRFFKRFSQSFTFSIFIYFTLGTYVFTLAAIKQVLGMSIVTLAFPYLKKKKWITYYLIIFVAMLVHTYAIIFAVLPFFRARPWSVFTFLFMTATIALMMNFKEAITAFMEQANDLGKTLADYEVFDDHTINLFRLAVYAAPVLVSFVFQKWIFRDTTRMDHILIHMGIISFAFMCMGTQAGANMFGRMGNYFELGTICILPKMLKKTFDDKSYQLVTAIACVCFLGFFTYANAISLDFGQAYNAISLWQLIRSLF